MNQENKLYPKDLFQTMIAESLSNKEQEVLALLYQPIIGAQAFSLYLTLLSEISFPMGMSEELFHSELITMLDLSIQQIETAKLKLEGIGLLDTFIKVENYEDKKYFYRLNHPETVERFFKDEVLALTLLNIVGQRKMDKLFKHFQPKHAQLTGLKNISASYKDVYVFRAEQIGTHQTLLNKMANSFADPHPPEKVSAVTDSFTWEYFLEGIKKLGVQLPDDVSGFKEEVYVFHNLFGINELDMVEFCSKSFDYYSNKIVIKEFEKAIYQTYDTDKKQREAEVTKNETADLTNEEQQTYRYNSLKMNGFSEQDILMIMDSERNFPLNYLEALKSERGGYTTPQERSLVKYLVSKSGLPNSVINVLINYVFNIQKQPTLKADYVNRIANEWAQSEIFSPEKAITHVRELARKGKEKQQNRNNYGTNRRPIRQETLPDWVENPTAEKKLSEERQAQLRKELNELLKEEGE
ncbi:replication initiation and membrane attachment family protein [Enterococcus sp. LJL99]